MLLHSCLTSYLLSLSVAPGTPKGGKPFVDDLVIEVGDNGTTEMRSASRIGESDFKVNQKRLAYFAKKLNDLGWNAPDPIY